MLGKPHNSIASQSVHMPITLSGNELLLGTVALESAWVREEEEEGEEGEEGERDNYYSISINNLKNIHPRTYI